MKIQKKTNVEAARRAEQRTLKRVFFPTKRKKYNITNRKTKKRLCKNMHWFGSTENRFEKVFFLLSK